MSRLEYELLRENEPQLHLGEWIYVEMSPIYRGYMKAVSREEFTAACCAAILAGKAKWMNPYIDL